jgi:hypothetical protein
MKNKQRGAAALLGLIVLLIGLAAAVGYVWNIVKLFGMTGIEGHVGEFVMRVAGLIPVIGAIVGYL